jgi:hypothetical protein
VSYSTPSLIGACVLIAAIALLFTTRYPPGLFDLAVGINRWSYRLLVYVALMTDHPSGSTRAVSIPRVQRNPQRSANRFRRAAAHHQFEPSPTFGTPPR